MGCTLSAVVGERAAAINDMLEDDEVIKKLLMHSSSLSDKSRQNLLLLAERPPGTSDTEEICSPDVARVSEYSELLDRKDLRPFMHLQPADVGLAGNLRRDFERWKKEPMTFFEGLDMDTGVNIDLSGYLSRQIHHANLLKRGGLKDRIRSRFFKVFFIQAESICHAGFGKLEQRMWRDWASRGRTYNYLRRNLGSGCLFLLPTVVGDTIWERRLSAKGKEREEVMHRLRLLGITKNARELQAETLEEIILTKLLAPLRVTSGYSAPMSTPASSTDDAQGNVALVTTRINRQSEQVFYRIPIIFDYDSPIFICVQNGDVEGMRALWMSGSASLDAVDPYNLGLLYYSTYYCWRNRGIETSVATFEALVHAGANVRWVDNLGNTPLDTMIDIFLVESAMRGHSFMALLSKLSGLFGKPAEEIWLSYLSSKGFTDLHNVLLRLNADISLEEYLTKTVLDNGDLSILHARDLTGRTALDWAVEHGWLCAAKSLIRCGADVRQSRYGGLSMLHLALAGPVSERGASFLEIVKLLLENGADANAVDDEGWTPLHIAASWGSDSAVELLRKCSDDTLLTYCWETADQLAQKNRDGQSLTKNICT
ncbi:hypothetical protein KVR01_012355 [Diaporthe batatas]|uniref:uncharacterized protein n=1 Tax=Diaporthe batatas TaxID=748121 RepID=UPI001D0559F6|nr:uncharacterized protein KVR01_012355 [Diaporthe batatas]KAG8157693.1 hypothetical protein KVR01_012355 [Diaporthe batatas]